MRVLILGVKGQLGAALAQALADDEVTGLDLPEWDITDPQAAAQAVSADRYTVAINCAAYTNVEGCAHDPALAYRVNAWGAQQIALACAAAQLPLVHISTNEVFPGRQTAGYDEWDPMQPINPYGASKAAGESLVRQLHSRHYIVRTAWLYAPGGRNFIHAILHKVRAGEALRVVADEISNPTYVLDLAQALTRLIHTHQYGTYHLTNTGTCSRWQFANTILRLAGLEQTPNTPILSQHYRRASTPPRFCALNNNAGAALGIVLRPWPEALADYLRAAS